MIRKILNSFHPTQKLLARWASWFFLANALLWILIASNYLSLLPAFDSIEAFTWQGKLLSYSFIASSYMGYFSLIAYGAWFVVAVFSLYWHQKWVVFLSIITAVFLSLFLVIDSFVYHLFHFHFWGVVWSILRAGVATEVLVLSGREWLFIAILVLGLLIIEVILALIVWRLVRRHAGFKYSDSIFYVVAASFFLSYALLVRSYATVDPRAKVVVSIQLINLEAQLIPFYNSVMGLLLPEKEGVLKLETQGGNAYLQLQKIERPLHYPLHPLHCQPLTQPYNIVMIVVDALRFETLNNAVMPKTTKFAQQSWQFKQHYSGGNATGPGIFSLFYGLPYNYWSAMQSQHRAPLLMDQLVKDHYEMAIYRSAAMHYPAFDESVFAGIKNLQLNTPGNRAYLRDQKITEEFSEFLARRNPKKPFFGFLFYDALHNYCQSPTPYPQPFQPAIKECNRSYLNEESDPLPYLNRYYNAAQFVDSLIARVLNDLKKRHLLKRTIVLITADHGEEFNESHQNYWGHVSAYTDWQLQVPFVLYWPGHAAKSIAYQSTHYEFAPWLLQNLLKCDNPAKDYSVGASLLKPPPRSFFMAHSYIDYAILSQDRISRIYPQGNYVISDRNAKPILGAQLDEKQLKELFEELERYFN